PDPVTATGLFLKDDGTWAVPTDTNTTYSNFAGLGASGLVPDPVAEASKYLKDDGTWDYPQVAPVFSGVGADGLVPDPVAETGKFLRDDGTWAAETTFSGAGAVGLVPDPVSTGGLFLKDNGGWAKEVSFTGAGTSGLVPDPVTATGGVLSDAGAWVTRPAYEHIVFDLVGPGVAIADTTYWVTNWPTTFIPHEIILNTQVHNEDFTADLKVNSVSFLTAGPKTISGNTTIVAQAEINISLFPSYQLLRGRTVELVLADVFDYGTADDGLQIIFKGVTV
ncbi:MAG: hypothetical protein Q8R28_07305, partial [Dehalococcoidia bacterium]|nr:hypothetical protein [Dehalococcoidia bacterium]